MDVVLGALVPHPPVMIPEVGGRAAQAVRRTRRAMKSLASHLAQLRPDTIILITPHATPSQRACFYYAGERVLGDLAAFGAPQVQVSWPQAARFIEELAAQLQEEGFLLRPEPSGRLDHGALVPLHFLNQAGVTAPVAVLAAPYWSNPRLQWLGQCLVRAISPGEGRVVIVASGDLSHRLQPGAPAGYHPRGAEFDSRLMRALRGNDLSIIQAMEPDLVEVAGQCAWVPLSILTGALAPLPRRARQLSYEAPFGVGYGVVCFQVSHPLVRLAAQALEAYLTRGEILDAPRPVGLSLPERAGVFVSLKQEGRLRGCLGTRQPTQHHLGQEVVQNAIVAATRDPRFAPVTLTELPLLEISVEVLSPPEAIAGMDQLDPQRYGVVVTQGARTGLLLPALPGINDARHQVAVACDKAGIDADDPDIELHRFQVERYE